MAPLSVGASTTQVVIGPSHLTTKQKDLTLAQGGDGQVNEGNQHPFNLLIVSTECLISIS